MNNSNILLRGTSALVILSMGIYFLSGSNSLPPMKDNMRIGLGIAFTAWGVLRGVQVFLKIKNK